MTDADKFGRYVDLDAEVVELADGSRLTNGPTAETAELRVVRRAASGSSRRAGSRWASTGPRATTAGTSESTPPQGRSPRALLGQARQVAVEEQFGQLVDEGVGRAAADE